jgi:hypothetical protein
MEGSSDRDYTSAVYGSLLVTTLIAVQWHHDVSTTFLGLSLVISVAVFWLTHVWAAIVNRRVHGPIDQAAVAVLARDEAPMLTAAVVPTILLALASAGVLEVDIGIGLALLVSLVQLFLWGLAVGWAAHASWPLAIGVAAVDGALGIAIVVLKVLVLH